MSIYPINLNKYDNANGYYNYAINNYDIYKGSIYLKNISFKVTKNINKLSKYIRNNSLLADYCKYFTLQSVMEKIIRNNDIYSVIDKDSFHINFLKELVNRQNHINYDLEIISYIITRLSVVWKNFLKDNSNLIKYPYKSINTNWFISTIRTELEIENELILSKVFPVDLDPILSKLILNHIISFEKMDYQTINSWKYLKEELLNIKFFIQYMLLIIHDVEEILYGYDAFSNTMQSFKHNQINVINKITKNITNTEKQKYKIINIRKKRYNKI